MRYRQIDHYPWYHHTYSRALKNHFIWTSRNSGEDGSYMTNEVFNAWQKSLENYGIKMLNWYKDEIEVVDEELAILFKMKWGIE